MGDLVTRDRISIIVCGQKYSLDKTSPKQLIHHMITAVLLEDPWISLPARIRNVQVMIDVLAEIYGLTHLLEDRERRKTWRRACKIHGERLGNALQSDNEVALLIRLYNHALSLEGLGLLGGFSVTGGIEKGLMNYNPEVRSIMKTY